MPVVSIQNNRQWYAEARYNYEDINTFSLYLGKTFSNNNRLTYSVTPILGGSVGRFKGISAGLNIGLEYGNAFFSGQSQYSFTTSKESVDFFYSWSEIGYLAFEWLYAGISFQHTWSSGEFLPETALMAGFSFNRFTIPLYAFDLFNEERYFVAGIIIAWKTTKKPDKVKPPLLVSRGN